MQPPAACEASPQVAKPSGVTAVLFLFAGLLRIDSGASQSQVLLVVAMNNFYNTQILLLLLVLSTVSVRSCWACLPSRSWLCLYSQGNVVCYCNQL